MFLVYKDREPNEYGGRWNKETIQLTDVVGIIANIDEKNDLIIQLDGNLNYIDDYSTKPILIPNNMDKN